MTAHSPRVFVVVDPPQDYEESLRIFGVHGSLAAAKVAARRYRRELVVLPNGASYRRVDAWRVTEIQLWQGDRVLGTWSFREAGYGRDVGRWTFQPSEPVPASP